MNGTPRLRSAYPSTPNSGLKVKKNDASVPEAQSQPSIALPNLSASTNDTPVPLVPFNVVDAPSQRLYIAFFYLSLTVWRLYDFSRLGEVEPDSLWLFMKWVAIDSTFLFGLPALRVPWMQWSSSTTIILFLMHGALNAVLMFRISVSCVLPSVFALMTD